MAVWDDLVGPGPGHRAAGRRRPGRRRAGHGRSSERTGDRHAAASKMTHAWLFTGPPGSGRATAARAFAAALQCVSPDRALGGAPGCGFCDGCHTTLVGTHADVEVVAHRPALHRREGDPRPGAPRRAVPGRRPLAGHRPGGRRPAHRGRRQRPAQGRRGTGAAHGLAAVRALRRGRAAHDPLPLPPSSPCAPRRSTRSPTSWSAATASTPELAAAAARATQGHIGRARRLATDERARERRAAVLQLPLRVDDIGGCLKAAQAAGRLRHRGRQAGRRGGRRQGDRGAAGRARRRRGHRRPDAARHRRRDEGSGRPAEAPFHPHPARHPRPGAHRPRRLLPRRARRPVRHAASPSPTRTSATRSTGSRRRVRPENTLRRIEAVLACREALDAQRRAAARGGGHDDGAARGLRRGRSPVGG